MAIASGHSIVWNGTDLDAYNLFVIHATKPLLPAPEMNIKALGGRDGAVSQGRRYEGRAINLRCAITSTNQTTRDTALASLRTLFKASQTGEKSLVVDLFGTDSWNARLTNALDVELAANGAEFDLNFFASYPWAKAAGLTSANTALSGSTPWSPSIGGTSGAHGIWTITDTLGGSTSITITNATTGQTVTYAHTLVAGEVVQFLSETQVVQRDPAGGTNWSTVLTGIGGTVPRLEAGTNVFTINGIATGTVQLQYYAESA